MTRHYTTLDGMRGLAAICVAVMHGQELFGTDQAASAYLAVDFFFVLSGFVIAHAYRDRLAGGLSAMGFMRIRVLRLYPLYLAGSLSTIALATYSMLGRHDDSLWQFAQPWLSLPFALLMLPSPASASLFPLNVPSWTLLFELVANAGYALRPVRARRWLLPAVIACAALALVAAALRQGDLDLGAEKATGAWGLARVLYGFPMGVLLYRIHGRVHVARHWAPLLLAALVLLMWPGWQGACRTAYDLVFVLVVSPALVLAGAAVPALGARLTRPCMVLGAVSYPLYALHQPTLHALFGTIDRHVAGAWLRPLLGAGVIALMLAGSWQAARLDARLRRWLTRTRLRAWGTGTAP